MTLREHIDSIAEVMYSQGAASDVAVLFYQLYLICLGLEGFHGYGIREARNEEPFLTLRQEMGGLWDLAYEQFEHDDQGPIEQYLSDEDLTYTTPPEEFQRTFTEILNGAARNGIKGFDHLQPSELSDLVWRMSGYREGEKIYNPFAGVGSYSGWFNAGDNYYGEEFDKFTWGIGVLRMWIFDSESKNYIKGDSLSPQWKEKFDLVVSTPPIGFIPEKKESYTSHLFKSLPSLLKKDGRAIIVTTMRQLFGQDGKELVDSGLLDSVVMLPRNVFYWHSLPAVVVRLKNGREESAPITLVDGSSFSKPGGIRTNIIDAGDIYRALESKNPDVCVELTAEAISQNQYRLNPSFYLQGLTVNADGIKMMSLSSLGELTKSFKIIEDIPEKGIRYRDLTSNISDFNYIEPQPIQYDEARKQVHVGGYRLVDKPVLLISGTPGALRFGYVATPPVYVQRDIFIFEPNEKLVAKDYLVYALSKAVIPSMGSSVIRLTADDLSCTMIPVPPIREQKAIIRKELQGEIARREAVISGQAVNGKVTLSRKKVKVATIGKVDIPQEASEDLSVCMHFTGVREAKTWMQKGAEVDAVIIRQDEDIKEGDISSMSMSLSPIPVFILSPDALLLEGYFGSFADDYLPGKCFEIGQEEELIAAVYALFDEKDSPVGRIREVYSRQLEAAANLDNKFLFEGVVLRDKLEEILLSRGATIDWRDELRKIRDKCFLEILSNYGFLPHYEDRKFAWGAMVNFLADKVYSFKRGEYYFLEKEILPRSLADMLKSCSVLLNKGAHEFRKSDNDTQWAALHIIMAVLCVLSDMVTAGMFDKLNYDDNATRYWNHEDSYRYETGEYEVMALKEDPTYFYVGNNIHLDEGQCKKEEVVPGDIVEIRHAGIEQRPYVNEFLKIVFYSKEFSKI